jgi:hypothetical protein
MGDNGFGYIFLWRIATLATNKYSLKKTLVDDNSINISQCNKYSLKKSLG